MDLYPSRHSSLFISHADTILLKNFRIFYLLYLQKQNKSLIDTIENKEVYSINKERLKILLRNALN